MSAPSVEPVPLPAKRRVAQLAMLAFAVLIVMAAYAAVGMGIDQKIPSGMLTYGLGLGGFMLAAYLVLARFAPWADPLILPLVTLINGLGLVMIYRLEVGAGGRGGASATTQLLWTAVGVVVFAVTLIVLRDHRALQRLTYTAGAAGLLLLVSPLLPIIGEDINGARIWIKIGGFTLQPAELAKLALIVFFAGYLVAKRDVLALAGRRLLFIDLPRARDLGPILITWGFSLGVLILQKDLGSSLLIFGTFIAMLYIATQRTSWVLIGILLFVGGAVLAGLAFDHVAARFEVFLNPESNELFYRELGGSAQLMEGLFGMSQGGILGTGLGQGHPGLIPLAFSDFIFAAIGEELGLTGLMALLMIYGLLVERGLRTALAARDPFSKLLAGGLSFILAWQVFIIVGGVTNLIPLTGLVTPFMSQGGSALLANWILIALLVRMSDAARKPPPQAIQDEGMTQVFQR
ncbi:FtsW/RodA/SpoVE family cell cycle protein [Planomonospora venezuelensis]|uniref:Cell division protein FtsW (Lipid II flippase) n=1 Tax=Planomonospora venezuelensis TaxID=1999 RepID=A0A841CSP1_PLAVE|nr:FtsW/RodA/SpoVE family cell cycle protein [Planomonospora venezuelensis]MBB5960811.1 cell division protein FtsW (lipid II flippase) [Planomonospora venezuelensis]GIN03795.1 cell division protein FtsW [Planomonospora venezuelensis]